MAETRREGILRKLKALADRGVGGEQMNAEALLNRMMEKYGVTEEELSDDVRTKCEFRYGGMFGRNLMDQIIVMVCGRGTCLYKRAYSRENITVAYCTKAERLEIEAAYSFYRRTLDKGLKTYYDAFVQVEYLFPKDVKVAEPGEADFEMMQLAMGMNKHSRLLEIEGG